eukprot:TRINITY_DN5803_c0_g1_i1.p1 TRINITY_DN5803_c0_g1~~TRINITY_DN5803_c0_g1_i1.p1  ORF type:complete len:658 (-),score=120.23 TRINITY_DN5803_c0_g1_i1:29-2002(-)
MSGTPPDSPSVVLGIAKGFRVADVDTELINYVAEAEALLINGRLADCEKLVRSATKHCMWSALTYAQVGCFRAIYSDDSAVFQDTISRLDLAKNAASCVRDQALGSKFKPSNKEMSTPLIACKKVPSGHIITPSAMNDIRRRNLVACSVISAEVYMWKSFVHFKALNWVRGAYFTRKAFKAYEEAMNEFNSMKQQIKHKGHHRSASTSQLPAHAASVPGKLSHSTPAQPSDSDEDLVGGVKRIAVSSPGFDDSNSERLQRSQTPQPSFAGMFDADDDDEHLLTDGDKYLEGLITFGVGGFQFGLSMIPPTFVWVAEMLGFTANRDAGLRHLKRCSERKSPKQLLALLFLGIIQGILYDHPPSVEVVVEKLLRLHPNAGLAYAARGYQFRLKGDLEESTACFRQASGHLAEIPQAQQVLDYETGHNLWLNLDYEGCVVVLEKYLKECTLKSYKAMGMYKLGFCYWKLNRHKEITALYQGVPKIAREKVAFDRYAIRKTREFLKARRFDEFEELFVPIMALREGKQHDRALELVDQLEGLVMCSSNAEYQALFYLFKGGLLRDKERWVEATVYLNKCVALDGKLKRETFAVPFSVVLQAEIAFAKEPSDVDEAKKLFAKAKVYTGYDFDNVLTFLIARGQEKIRLRDAGMVVPFDLSDC